MAITDDPVSRIEEDVDTTDVAADRSDSRSVELEIGVPVAIIDVAILGVERSGPRPSDREIGVPTAASVEADASDVAEVSTVGALDSVTMEAPTGADSVPIFSLDKDRSGFGS